MTEKKYKIKDVKKALGNLQFLSYVEDKKETSRSGRNTRIHTIGRVYQLLSDIQNDVSVIVQGAVPILQYPFQAKVELVNPQFLATAKQSGYGNNRFYYVDWAVICDGIKVIS